MAEVVEQNILVNSLVTLNISDHWTRVRVQNGSHRVFGALLGKQSGRFIEILNSFEVNALELDGYYVIDEEYFAARDLLFKETFPSLEFVGFYATGGNPSETDVQDAQLQKQAMRFNESPLLLKFDTEVPIVRDKLSMCIFECVIDPTDEANVIFHHIPIKIVSELAEQIGLDHVARLSKTGTLESTASNYLTSQFGAINTLLQGITLARNYLMAVRQQKVERDPAILKDIYKLCQKLSAEKPQDLLDNEEKRVSDQKLMVLLCSLTSTEGALSSLITKVNMLSSDRYSMNFSGGGGMGGTMKKHPYFTNYKYFC